MRIPPKKTQERIQSYSGQAAMLTIILSGLIGLSLSLELKSTTKMETDFDIDEILLQNDVSQNLLLHYSFNEGTMAKRIADSSGNNMGTVNGTPRYVNGKEGLALKFEGRDLVKSDVNLSGNFTQSVWLYSEDPNWGSSDIPNEGRWITNDGEFQGIYIELSGQSRPKIGYRYQSPSGQKYTRLIDSINNDKWVHIVISKEGDKLNFYKNGRLKNVIETGATRVWESFQIGGKGYWYSGKVDEVTIYNRTISGKEVRSLYYGQGIGLIPHTEITLVSVIISLFSAVAYVRSRGRV